MFGSYVYEKASAEYEERILLIDDEQLDERTNYSADFSAHGFEVVRYKNDLSFRIDYPQCLPKACNKLVVIAKSTDYIPYDVRQNFRTYMVSLQNLFPKLNSNVLQRTPQLNLDMLCLAYGENFENLQQSHDTELFLKDKVMCSRNVNRFLQYQYGMLVQQARECSDYLKWYSIAEKKSYIDVLSTQYELDFDTNEINTLFRDWILKKYGSLSAEINTDTPVLVSRAMEYMHDCSQKFVIIVMDGMSEFDWEIIAHSFAGIKYQKTSAFAMIPTVTSVSRQCLLSNKYPKQLISPWTQSKEKHEFIACAKDLGYTDNQISYQRGYDADFGSLICCGAIIINDVDDMVHGQMQGRLGMLNDIGVLAKQAKLAEMTHRFLHQGFDVYISADHGNTPCTGMGKLMGTGVETETKSRRMLVLKEIADKDGLKEKYGLIEFPKYYLMKEYDYLICDVGKSFDAKGEDVMSHGGITIDEVVVPFIKIKAVENNG